jgi:hypothetical protein
LASGGESGIAKFWDVATGAERGKVEHVRYVLSGTVRCGTAKRAVESCRSCSVCPWDLS